MTHGYAKLFGPNPQPIQGGGMTTHFSTHDMAVGLIGRATPQELHLAMMVEDQRAIGTVTHEAGISFGDAGVVGGHVNRAAIGDIDGSKSGVIAKKATDRQAGKGSDVLYIERSTIDIEGAGRNVADKVLKGAVLHP